MNIDRYLNDELQIDNSIYDIAGESSADPTVYGYSGNESIRKYTFNELEVGMQLKKNNSIKRIQKISIDRKKINNQPSYYFLHIKKASGISLQKELRKNFLEYQTFINPIIHVDEKQMLNSNFISGHFARYPIDLFKLNGLNLKTICLFRNPVDRILSQFNYEHYFNNWKNKINTNPKFDDLLEYIYVPGRYLANLQARSICSTIDINESKRITKLFLSDMITAETLFDKIAKTGFLNYEFYLDNWEEMLSEMSLIGTVDNRDKFLYNLSIMLKEDGYPSYMENKIWNKTFIDINYFKSNLSKNDIEKIQNDNIYDNEIYQYLKVRNK